MNLKKNKIISLFLFFGFSLFLNFPLLISAENIYDSGINQASVSVNNYYDNQNLDYGDDSLYYSGGAKKFLATIISILQRVAVLIVGLAVIYFLWGLIKYGIAKSAREKGEAKSVIINGLIILFVMVSIWGLVYVLMRTFNLGYYPPENSFETIDNII